MDNIHAFHGGFLARHVHTNHPLSLLPSVKWWHDGNCILSIPVSIFDNISLASSEISNYLFFKDFYLNYRKQKLTDARICDLNYVLLLLTALLNQVVDVLEKTKNTEKMSYSICIENMNYSVPFLNDPEYVKQIEELGIPITSATKLDMPNTLDYGLFKLNLDKDSDSTSKSTVSSVLRAIPIFATILNSIGVLNCDKDIAKFKNIYLNPIKKTS